MAATTVTRQSTLPTPLTRLVGREQEIGEVRDLLTQPHPSARSGQAVRLLTLTGPGGVGKTRLAIAVAGVVSESFSDGVSSVSLAAITDPALVASMIVGALGLAEVGGREPFDR